MNSENLTYGRSETETNQALEALINQISKIISTMDKTKSETYKQFIQTLNSCWQGEDKDKFLNKFEEQRLNIYESLEDYKRVIENVFEEDLKLFLVQQRNNDIMEGI